MNNPFIIFALGTLVRGALLFLLIQLTEKMLGRKLLFSGFRWFYIVIALLIVLPVGRFDVSIPAAAQRATTLEAPGWEPFNWLTHDAAEQLNPLPLPQQGYPIVYDDGIIIITPLMVFWFCIAAYFAVVALTLIAQFRRVMSWRRQVLNCPKIQNGRLFLIFKTVERSCAMEKYRISLRDGSRILPVPASFGSMGWRIILCPAAEIEQYSDQEIKMLILHEMAHFRNRDNVSGLFAHMISALLFFNPFFKWTLKRLVLVWELDCDAYVRTTMRLSRADEITYARLLFAYKMKLNELAPSAGLGLSAEAQELHLRLKEMSQGRVNKRRRVVALITGITAATFFAMLTPGRLSAQELVKSIAKEIDIKNAADVTLDAFSDFDNFIFGLIPPRIDRSFFVDTGGGSPRAWPEIAKLQDTLFEYIAAYSGDQNYSPEFEHILRLAADLATTMCDRSYDGSDSAQAFRDTLMATASEIRRTIYKLRFRAWREGVRTPEIVATAESVGFAHFNDEDFEQFEGFARSYFADPFGGEPLARTEENANFTWQYLIARDEIADEEPLLCAFAMQVPYGEFVQLARIRLGRTPDDFATLQLAAINVHANFYQPFMEQAFKSALTLNPELIMNRVLALNPRALEATEFITDALRGYPDLYSIFVAQSPSGDNVLKVELEKTAIIELNRVKTAAEYAKRIAQEIYNAEKAKLDARLDDLNRRKEIDAQSTEKHALEQRILDDELSIAALKLKAEFMQQECAILLGEYRYRTLVSPAELNARQIQYFNALEPSTTLQRIGIMKEIEALNTALATNRFLLESNALKERHKSGELTDSEHTTLAAELAAANKLELLLIDSRKADLDYQEDLATHELKKAARSR